MLRPGDRSVMQNLLIIGGTISSGQRYTFSVTGWYWMSSNCSHECTTPPGVTARSRPTSNASAATIDGTRGGGGQVRDEGAQATHHALAACVDERLGRDRAEQRVVARRGRGDQVAEKESQPRIVAPAELGAGQQRLGRRARGQVSLDAALEPGIAGPGRIGETAIPRGGRARGPARRDPAQLGAEQRRLTADHPGSASQGDGQPQQRAVRPEAAHDAEGRVGQQQVKGTRRVRRVRRACVRRACVRRGSAHPASSGGRTSRRRIFPVGPLGSDSTSQICRGYLYAATLSLANERNSCGVAEAPGFSATAAATSSPSSACGIPITATSATAGCSCSTSSISRG